MTFAGSPDRVEAQLVPEAGYELDTFRISGLPRRPSPALARALLLAGRAPRACARILRRRANRTSCSAAAATSSGPMVYAAARRKIPTALMEADAHLGLANRLAAPFARRVFLSFPIAGRDGAKYRVTGRPIPARSRARAAATRRGALFGLPAAGPVLLVFGGSLGAHLLNELAIDAFGEAGPAVLHLSGTRDYDELRPRVTRPDYRLFAFTEEFGAALGASDLALARAGGSVWELAAAGKPAVLVPGLFATGDHQTKNARYFERARWRGRRAGGRGRARARGDPLAARRSAAARGDVQRDARSSRGPTRRTRSPRSSLPSPLDGRRFWIAGIGGAGMSALRARSRGRGAPRCAAGIACDTPYLEHLEGIDVEISDEPSVPPEGWEPFVSTAFAGRVAGQDARGAARRARVAARLDRGRRARTARRRRAAMIAFCLERLGRDPAWLIGARRPAARRERRAPATGWLVVEGDESDRTIAALRPRIAVVTNVDLDHHATFGSRAEVEELFDDWLANVPDGRARRGARRRTTGRSRVPGEHNRRNAALRSRRSSSRVSSREEAAAVLAEFRGRGAAARAPRRGGERRRLRRLRASSGRDRRDTATRCGTADGRLLVLFQPHLYSRTRHLARELAAALAAADVVAVTDVYRGREEPVDGVTRQARRRRARRAAAGDARRLDAVGRGRRTLSREPRPGRATACVTIGAGDVDRAATLLLETLA